MPQTIDVLDASGDLQTIPTMESLRGRPVTIDESGSLGITTAAIWDLRRQWAIPAGYVFRPVFARCVVTTASSETLIAVGRRLGTLTSTTAYTFTVNTGTDVVTAAGHTFANDQVVAVRSSTTLPGGLVVALPYYVINVSGNDFQLSTSLGGGAVDITSAGSGTHTIQGQEFVADASVASPYHFSRLFALITTTMSAIATDLTLTYTDQDGNTASTTAKTIPSAAPAGNLYECVLAAGGVGARAVTHAYDSAAPTGVIDIWGMNTLLENHGIANALDVVQINGSLELTEDDTVFILFNAAATTAQQRSAGITGYLVDAP